MSLFGKEIYYHLSKDNTVHDKMMSLIGAYVKELDSEILKGVGVLYPIKLSFPGKKSQTVYLKEKEQQQQWMESFQNILQTRKIEDYFKIKEKVGEGKFGQVRKSFNRQTGEVVAVKIQRKNNMDKLEIELLRSEIEILKVCTHPNIVQLIDVFESKNHQYIVMEYMRGDSLSHFFKARGEQLNEGRVIEMAYQISLGIKYIHDLGIMHRDLKLANILMSDSTDQAQLKLADFGFSTIVGPSQQANEGMGSLIYTAPEIISGKPYGLEIDLWSFGVILYYLLTGEYPFVQDSTEALVHNILNFYPTFESPKCGKLSLNSINLIQEHEWFQNHKQSLYMKQLKRSIHSRQQSRNGSYKSDGSYSLLFRPNFSPQQGDENHTVYQLSKFATLRQQQQSPKHDKSKLQQNSSQNENARLTFFKREEDDKQHLDKLIENGHQSRIINQNLKIEKSINASQEETVDDFQYTLSMEEFPQQ
eukprot:403339273